MQVVAKAFWKQFPQHHSVPQLNASPVKAQWEHMVFLALWPTSCLCCRPFVFVWQHHTALPHPGSSPSVKGHDLALQLLWHLKCHSVCGVQSIPGWLGWKGVTTQGDDSDHKSLTALLSGGICFSSFLARGTPCTTRFGKRAAKPCPGCWGF